MADDSDSAQFIDAEGVWCQVLPGAVHGGPGLFLDRDGVVVEEVDFLARAEDVALISGAAAVIAAANERCTPVILVTNQSGIGRGYYGWREFAAVQEAILTELVARGARVDAVYACPHHPDAKPPYAHPDHPARKPNPGMLLRAAMALELDLARSWLVGDKAIDVDAARRAGFAGGLHVLTGYGVQERALLRQGFGGLALRSFSEGEGFELRLGRSIYDAMALLPLLARR